MSDLARLGMRIESEEVATADKRLDDFAAAAGRAEKATDSLTGGSKRAGSAASEMGEAIRRATDQLNEEARSQTRATASLEQGIKATNGAAAATKAYATRLIDVDAHMVEFYAHQKRVAEAHGLAGKGARLQANELLNLSRQFSDIGVTAAMGMNPLMILIQQGPQVADVFAQAAARGVTFRAALAGIVADVAPLIATFAPLIAGLAAVAGGVLYLVDAHNKQATAIKTLNSDLNEQRETLSQLSPWIFTTGQNSDLAAEGQRNFDRWLKTANISIAEQNRLLRENALNSLNVKALQAADKLRIAQEQFDRVNQRGPSMMASPGGFGVVAPVQSTDPTNNPFYKEAAANLAIAKEAVKAIGDYQAKMGQAPTSAFAGEAPRSTGGATGTSRRSTGRATDAVNDNLRHPAPISVDPEKVVDLEGKIGRTIKAPEMDPTFKDFQKERERTEQEYRDRRIAAESKMWDGLVGLQYSGNKKIAAVGKAAAIYQATIDGIAAVQSALKSLPFPLNLAAAGVMTALTAANVAQIAGVKGFKGGGWTGNGATDQISGVTHGQEFVVKAGPAAANRAMLEAMNAGQPVQPPARPDPPPSANLGGLSVRVIKGDLFDVIVDRRATAVAAPLASRAREEGAQTGMAGAADQFTRRNVKALR